MIGAAYVVEQVPPEATRPLRQRLLKQNSTLDDLARSDGSYPDAGYYAAIDHRHRILAVASARPEAPPWPHDATHPWRIRGVVTAEDARGRGVGTAVVQAVLQHIRAHGGDLTWLNGRTHARSFYERLGFTQHGNEWDDPESGPHMTMVRPLLGAS
jgi:GNAT superfamily N-acetyltransferase